jgi:hypothetical protein
LCCWLCILEGKKLIKQSSQCFFFPLFIYPVGNSQYGQQQDAYQGPPPQQGYPPQQQQYPGQQGYPGQQQGYGNSLLQFIFPPGNALVTNLKLEVDVFYMNYFWKI